MMDDLISRRAAIDACTKAKVGAFPHDAGVNNSIEALKALPSAQPEQDCMLKQFGNCSYSETGCSDCVIKAKIRMALSSAQSEQRWIPVSERLPDVGKEVLVCYDFKGHRSVLIGTLYGDEKFHGYDDEYLTPEGRLHREAVAWMPLPKPWGGRRMKAEEDYRELMRGAQKLFGKVLQLEWRDPEKSLPQNDEFVIALVTGIARGIQCEHAPVIASYCADDPENGGWMLIWGQDRPYDNWKVDAWMPVPEWDRSNE